MPRIIRLNSIDYELPSQGTLATSKDFLAWVIAANTIVNTSGASGVSALGAVGGSGSANGAAISGNTLTLQPASGTDPGVLTAGAQSIGGAKTFTGAITASNMSGTNTGDVTLAAVGSSPSANGASLSGQILTLQPASSTLPGLLTAGAQTIGGAKTFAAVIGSSVTTGNAFVFNTNVVLDTTGGVTGSRLGINNAAPSFELDVTGTARITGGVQSNSLDSRTASTITYTSSVANGANTAHTFSNSNTFSNAAALLADFQNHGTTKLAIGLNGKMIIAGGAGGSVGTSAAMTAGSITISTTGVTAASNIFLTHAGANVANAGILSVGTIVAGTSFVINSINGADTDTVNWWIVN